MARVYCLKWASLPNPTVLALCHRIEILPPFLHCNNYTHIASTAMLLRFMGWIDIPGYGSSSNQGKTRAYMVVEYRTKDRGQEIGPMALDRTDTSDMVGIQVMRPLPGSLKVFEAASLRQAARRMASCLEEAISNQFVQWVHSVRMQTACLIEWIDHLMGKVRQLVYTRTRRNRDNTVEDK
jgi:hypothetical protein